MKILLLFVALLFTITSAKAQYGRRRYYQLGVGAEVAMPSGTYMSNVYKRGIGGAATVLLPVGLKDALSFTGSAYSFMTKRSTSDEMVMGMVGYRGSFYLINELFYVEPKAGITIVSSRQNGFAYAGGIGHVFADTWDLSLRYQSSVSNKAREISFIGLNLSYDFDLW